MKKKKVEKINNSKPLTCYTIIRKPSGYFSLIKLKAKDYDVVKDSQETTQEQVFRQIDTEFHKMRLALLKPENKNDDGTVSL